MNECLFNVSALEISPNDPKALYRRSTAYEHQGLLEDAYKDAVLLVKVDPKNTSVRPLLNRLTPIMKEKVRMLYTPVNDLFTVVTGHYEKHCS